MFRKRAIKISGKRTLAEGEFFIGILLIALGIFNILQFFDVLKFNFEIPNIIANVFLVIGGLVLIKASFKLWHARKVRIM